MQPNRKRIAVGVVLAVALGTGLWAWKREQGAAQAADRITANGTIEADEVEIGAQRPARLARYEVEEGQAVRKGQLVAVLDRSELEAQLAQAQGAAQRAAARLAELEKGTRAEKIQQATGQVEQARAGVSGAARTIGNAQKGFNRRTPLRQALDAAETQLRVSGAAVRQAEANRSGAEEALQIAQRDFDTSVQLRTARDNAAQAVATSEAAARTARARLAELENGARPEEIRQAEARVRQAGAAVDQAREELSNARIEQARTRALVLARAEAQQKLDAATTRAQTAEARVRQTQQARTEAEAALEELKNGVRPEQVEQARSSLRQAEAALDGNRKTLTNAQETYELRLGAAAALEAARTRRDQAQAQVNSARSTREGAEQAVRTTRTAYADALSEKQAVDTARQQYDTAQGVLRTAQGQLSELKNGATPEQLAQARADVIQARGALKLAQVQYQQSVIRAPRDGVLTEHVARVGEVVNPGSVVARLIPLDDVYLTLYVPLTELGRVKLRQKADITADTYPGKVYAGEVNWISETPEFTPRNVQTKDEWVKLVFQVKVRIANPRGELKPGMPADAVVYLR